MSCLHRTLIAFALLGLSAPAACAAGSFAPIASPSPGGAWTDEYGNAITLAEFRGAPVVLTAIYTSCTIRCPLTVEKLRAVDEAFRKEGRSFSVVILTLDPAVDTPERLQRFKRERGLPAHWHFFRGSDADTRALARALRVDPAFDVGHIDHNVRILVLDAGGYAARAFSGWDFAPDEAVVR